MPKPSREIGRSAALALTTDGQRLAWVQRILERECNAGTYGKVVIHLEGGTIVRVNTEKSEVPEK